MAVEAAILRGDAREGPMRKRKQRLSSADGEGRLCGALPGTGFPRRGSSKFKGPLSTLTLRFPDEATRHAPPSPGNTLLPSDSSPSFSLAIGPAHGIPGH